jgi:hypothetical protein
LQQHVAKALLHQHRTEALGKVGVGLEPTAEQVERL